MATIIVELSSTGDARAAVREQVEAAAAVSNAADADVARAQAVHRGIDRIWSSHVAAEGSTTALVSSLGGQHLRTLRSSGIVIYRAPLSALTAIQAHPGVRSAYVDQQMKPSLSVATASMGVPTFWNAGFTGGSVDVAVVDSGIYGGNEAFTPRISSIYCGVYHNSAVFQANYADDSSTCYDFQGHGTGVAGMIFSQGTSSFPNGRGTAFGLDKLYSLKAAYLTPGGSASMTLADLYSAIDDSLQVSDPPEVINVSYGSETLVDDNPTGRFYDSLVTTFGTVVTLPSGNSGAAAIDTTVSSFNGIVVGNIDDRGTVDRSDDVIAPSSSRGPSPGGRKKPDLVAPGSNILMPSNMGGFAPDTGTSFAAPALGGAAALLIQSGTTDPRAVKAVLINSADDYGAPGWDTAYGWGYYNGARAFAERGQVRLASVTGLGGANPVRFFEVGVTSSTWMTIAWNRQAIHNGTTPPASTFLADLDLRLYSRDLGSLRSQSVSAIDNVEQVSSGVTESKVAVVEAGSNYSGSETFALAHNVAITERQGPRPSVTPTAVPAIAPNATFVVTATWTNIGDLPAHLPQLSIALPSGYTLVSGAVTKAVGGSLQPGAGAQVSWTVRAPATYAATPATVTFYGDTTSFGWVFSGQGSTQLTMIQPPVDNDGDGLPDTWETLFGLNPGSSSGPNGASGDPDGDGRTNVQEYFDGTHPRGFVTRFLAEGSTGSFFDTRLAIVAPDAPAKLMIRYLKDDGTTVLTAGDLAAGTRLTVDPKLIDGLANATFSTVVESDALVVVDRTMTWDATGYGSHAETALTSASTTWYLAEGSTSGGFNLFYLLQNPNNAPATVQITYLLPFGQAPIVKSYTLRPSSRTNIYVDEQGGALTSTDVSAVITSSIPIIVERAMYADRPGQPFAAGHESAGVTAAAQQWFLAEGATGAFFDMFVLIANPNPAPVVVTADYLLLGGGKLTKQYTVPANGRYTIWVDDEELPSGSGNRPLANAALSTSISATSPVIVERSMWWPSPELGPNFWYEAHNSPGATATGTRWALADGAVGGARGEDTYVLIANTSAFAGAATVRLLFEDGTSAVRNYTLPAASRTNVAVGPDFPSAANRRFATIVESIGAQPAQIVVERAMYSSTAGSVWAAGSNALATRLQ